MKRLVVIACVAGLLVMSISTGFASFNQWLWDADNHVEVTPGHASDHTSLWTDGVHQFVRSSSGGGWMAEWIAPGDSYQGETSGVCIIRNPDYPNSGSSGRLTYITSFTGSNNALDPTNYWDLNKGVTMSWRVFIAQKEPDSSGSGNIYFTTANESSAGLPGITAGHGPGLWWGWDYGPGDNIQINVYNNDRAGQKDPWLPLSNVLGVWSEWTLSMQRFGDAVAWNLWIDGLHYSDPAHGGNTYLQTSFGSKLTNSNTHIRYGQARSQPFAHKTAWDRIGVTNYGVVAAWDGVSAVPEPSSLLALATGFAGMAGFALRRRR